MIRIPAKWQAEIEAGTPFGLRAVAMLRKQEKIEAARAVQGVTSKRVRSAGTRVKKAGTGCFGCGEPKSVKRPAMLQRAKSAAAALVRFVGDGMKSPTPEEQADRRMICNDCPLNENGICNGCGCVIELKIAARLESCPASKWHAALHPVRPIVDPICNLIMHVLPVASNDVWKWNLEQVAQRQDLFNGKRVLAIATDGRAKSGRKQVQTVSASEVIEFSESIGMNWTHTREFQNNHTLREVVSFPWLLETVCSGNPNELTFACHAKGVTHSMDSITVRWAERQYRVCLDDWQTVWRTMERFSMAGSFRRFGQFTTPRNNQWHYSGTNYWFRHDDVFSRDWRTIDQRFFGTESWPGRMFLPEDCACLFADDAGDAYKEVYWNGLQRQIDIWEGSRQ